MKLTSPSEVKKLMEEFGVRFNKGYGQNFLINEAVPARIAEECGAAPSDGILEIGPGVGTLTYELALRYSKVVALEIDSGLIPILGRTLDGFENVKIINADVMKTDLPDLVSREFGGRVSVCANLPYYITSPVLMRLIGSTCPFDNITVMVQKEVAERICAAPREDGYGALSVAISRFGKAQRLFTVSPGSFMPAPKVESAVVRIMRHAAPPYTVKDEEFMTKVVRAAFSQRRKTLINALSSGLPYGKEQLAEAVKNAGFAATVRGEELSTEDFAALSDEIFMLNGAQ